jgi:predicted O-linked N-acetylglucosamine transferase (SPINDLY family)
MSDHLTAAQGALQAGRRDEAITHLVAAVTENPQRTIQVYRALVVQLYNAGRFAEGEAWAARGLERHPRDYDLMNTRGVLLRKLKRQPEAAQQLEQAIKVRPKDLAAQQNLGNVLLDLREGGKAEAVFTRLVRADPRNSEYQRQLGKALARQGKIEPAMMRFRQAVSVKRDNIDAWLDMVGALNDDFRSAEAEAVLDKAIAQNPSEPRLLEGKAMVMRRAGDSARCEAWLTELLPTNPDAAWLHYQLGMLVGDRERERANTHLRRAHQLEPAKLDYATALVETLERTRAGDEGGHIEEAYQLALTLLPRRLEFTDGANKIMSDVFTRVADFDAIDAIGDFRTLGRSWASHGRHTALLKQLARVRGEEDRLELVEQHRIWGREAEATAARRPIQRPPPRPRDGKVRLGFMSSDLRQHPVGYFAMPLFDHVDPRFEVYVYSYNTGREDAAHRHIASRIQAYRWWPDISTHAAAQAIADDNLDILIELGGSTHMNRLEVMAYKPAPVQASWLGYPHSAGLSTIDYFVCDPFSNPTKPEYLVETPLVMPKTWLALGQQFFSDRNAMEPEPPSARNGFITYGTANNPHKYTRDVLRQWARVVAATPGSKFAFIRPEGSGASFRRNIAAQFAHEGVTEDRLIFHAVRGAHLPFYNQIDVSLDPFPLTGGTTTTESLWMGVPLVSLVGEAFFERLSYSILSNAGLGDLCARDLDAYVRLATELAADEPRRRALRAVIRDQLRASPLGQTERFAADFYELIHGAVTRRAG